MVITVVITIEMIERWCKKEFILDITHLDGIRKWHLASILYRKQHLTCLNFHALAACRVTKGSCYPASLSGTKP